MINLEGKVALVTGGANGIGKAISKKLAEAGATVVINYDSSESKANALVNEISLLGKTAIAIKANVSNFVEATTLIDEVVSKLGKIDILVNNAGITSDNFILRMSEEEFDKVIATNLKGTWNCSKQAAKYMSKQRFGKIINISSIVGLVGNAGQSNYAASKAGIIGLTKALAKELAKRNVLVNAIAPGFIETEMTKVLPEAIINQYLESIPLSKFGSVEDVANMVCFLASSLADYITGQVINVDGGMVM